MNTRDYLKGKSFDGYKFFGAHKKDKGYIFRLLAAGADKAYLIGDFNDWQRQAMRKYSTGVFSLSIDKAKPGDRYQFVLVRGDDEFKKIDPYSRVISYEDKSSIIVDDSYKFTNKKINTLPKNILQVYLGSLFKNKKNANQIFKDLLDHAKANSYTSILLMPINEYQNYKSLGYSSMNLFSYSLRYGDIKDFKNFIDLAHKNGIQVIAEMDISEFDPDSYGLINFDGSASYNYDYEDICYNYFGQVNYDISKDITKSYIKSAVDYYIKEYKLDGIYFSSIENSIYWQGDEYRGVNKEWVNFIKEINFYIKSSNSLALASFNGKYDMDLNFSYVYDTRSKSLVNMMKDPPFKRDSYKHYINDMIEANNGENILGFSYVDSYQNEANLAMKIYSTSEKFEQMKTLLFFLYTLDSPKVLFMGDDRGDLRTFSAYNSFDFKNIERKIEGLEAFYKDLAKLFVEDKNLGNNPIKIQVLDTEGYSLYAYKRIYKKASYLIIVNFTDIDYQIPSPYKLEEIFNTESLSYGGSGNINGRVLRKEIINIEAYSAAVFKII